MNLRTRQAGRARTSAIVSSRASRRYALVAALGVTLAPTFSLGASRAGAAHSAPATSPIALRRAHDLHLTYSRVEVTGNRIEWRVRLFRDDLEKTLQAYAHRPALSAATPAGDSVFAAYFNERVRVHALGAALTGRVVESGRDAGSPEPEMWWYVIDLRAPAPIRTLSVNVALLFEHFKDQRNVVALTSGPGTRRISLYFAAGDTVARPVVF